LRKLVHASFTRETVENPKGNLQPAAIDVVVLLVLAAIQHCMTEQLGGSGIQYVFNAVAPSNYFIVVPIIESPIIPLFECPPILLSPLLCNIYVDPPAVLFLIHSRSYK